MTHKGSLTVQEQEIIVTDSPSKLRQDIGVVQTEIESVRKILLAYGTDRDVALGAECSRAARSLQELLTTQSVPEEYRVAVVGRFKAGKSFFVNELLGYKLAGEETNPETAAITSFRYGAGVKARVHFVPMEQWLDLKRLYSENPKNLDAQRMAIWSSFPSRKRDEEGKQHFDESSLQSLEHQHIVRQGKYLELSVNDPSDKKLLMAFRKELKQYTTATRPHHCLVERIDITAPSVLLEQGVLLIDTPGLDDPERFRVTLTEGVVQDVDAVLFLTKSGASYGQTEKDFVLSLLRRGTIKQLIIVVTQVDHTYSQYIEQARSDEEDPTPIARRVDQERQRLRNQIDATFGALTDGDAESLAIARYREQLGDLQIIFTSAINHRRHKEGSQVDHPLYAEDPGGMRSVERTLMEVLSTESRLVHVYRALRAGALAEIDEILRLIESRKIAVHGVKDKEVAEQTLGAFRGRFDTAGSVFESTVNADVRVFKLEIEGGDKLAQARTQTIVLSASLVLREFETDDAARHWRTRRNGNWGYMRGLQLKVANAIFPKVTELLLDQQAAFSNFVRKFETHLATLTDESRRISADLGVGAEIQIDVATRLGAFLERTLAALQSLIESEETKVNTLLDDFVSKQVEDNITEIRNEVSEYWGTGTTAAQTRKVNAFYMQVNDILQDALREYLLKSIKQHSDILFCKAEELPALALTEVTAELERIAADIKAAAESASTEQKATFDATARRLKESLLQGSKKLVLEMGSSGQVAETKTPAPSGDTPGVEATKPAQQTTIAPNGHSLLSLEASASTGTNSATPDWSRIRRSASTFLRRFDLFTGQSKWGWENIFQGRFVRDARYAKLVDSYLDKAHQRRNLGEVVQLLNSRGSLKEIHVITGSHGTAEDSEGDDQLRELAMQLEHLGIELTWDRDDREHDRYLLLSNGVRFDLGMGLDIYGMARNLSVSNSSLRKIRKQTTISVFGPKGFA